MGVDVAARGVCADARGERFRRVGRPAERRGKTPARIGKRTDDDDRVERGEQPVARAGAAVPDGVVRGGAGGVGGQIDRRPCPRRIGFALRDLAGADENRDTGFVHCRHRLCPDMQAGTQGSHEPQSVIASEAKQSTAATGPAATMDCRGATRLAMTVEGRPRFVSVPRYQPAARKSPIAAATASGWSSSARWPAPATASIRASPATPSAKAFI